MKSTFLSRFTPSLMAAETLEAMFVKRHELAKDLVEVIRISALTENKHFRLLIGPRGIGKTHMMALIYHRIAKMEDLRDRLLIAWLQEEENVTSFLDLLLRIFRALEKEYPAEYDALLNQKVEALYQLSADEAEYKAAALLREFVGKRVLLLLIENLDDLFNGLGDIGQKQLRAYIQNYSFLTIVATAQSLFNAVRLQTYPFYGFFYTEELEDLKLEEAIELLAHIAKLEGDRELESFIKTTTGSDRIRAIHHLAAGNPRVYVVFAQFLSRKSLDELVEPFMRTLDELTPYYQSRMAWLSQPQRKIVEFLVDRRGAVPVTEIAQRSFISVESASSQLKDLREKGYVNSEAIGRESFYELREPLMRFCLEVKKQRREPIRLFVDFLRIWYTRIELQQLLGLEIGRFRQERGFDELREVLSGGQMDKLPLEKHYFRYQQPLEPLPADAVMEREYVKRALEAIEEAEEDPRVAAYLEEYKQYREKEDYVSALEYANKLVAIRGQAKDWLKQGDCLDDLNRKEEALESLDKAIALDPNSASAWNSRGYVLDNLSRKEEALESYEKGIALDPNLAKAWNNRGLVLDDLNRKEEALESYDKAIALDPNYRWAWANRGNVLNNLKRYEEALASLDKAIEIDPNYTWAWAHRGDVLNNLNRKQEALESFDKAIALDPDYRWAWANRGNMLNNLKRYEEALASLDKAIEIDPNYAWVWAHRGDVLNNLEHYEEALESFDKAVALDPDYQWAWVNRGDVLNNLKRYEEALASLDKAIEIDPDYQWAWANRGDVLNNLKRYEEALESFDKAVALDPDYQWAWVNRGDVLNNLKRYEEALASLDKAIEIDPNTSSGWCSRGYVLGKQGYFLGIQEYYEEAIVCFNKMIELDEQDATAWNNRGWVLCRLGKYNQALISAEKAMELGFPDWYVFFNRAESLLALNNWDEEGIGALDDALARFAQTERTEIDNTEALIRNLFNSTSDAEIWKIQIKTLIELYNKHKVISTLTQVFVEFIPALTSEIVSDKAAETWLEVWRDLVGEVSEFIIPLRLLNAAVRYKITKGDKRVLLELPIEERNLLQPLLETDTSED